MKRKTTKPPYKSVRKLQEFFNESLLYSEESFPLGDYMELGSDGIYRQSNT